MPPPALGGWVGWAAQAAAAVCSGKSYRHPSLLPRFDPRKLNKFDTLSPGVRCHLFFFVGGGGGSAVDEAKFHDVHCAPTEAPFSTSKP